MADFTHILHGYFATRVLLKYPFLVQMKQSWRKWVKASHKRQSNRWYNHNNRKPNKTVSQFHEPSPALYPDAEGQDQTSAADGDQEMFEIIEDSRSSSQDEDITN